MASSAVSPNPSMKLGRQNAAAPVNSAASSSSGDALEMHDPSLGAGQVGGRVAGDLDRVGPVHRRTTDDHEQVWEVRRAARRVIAAAQDIQVLARVELRDEQDVGTLAIAAGAGDDRRPALYAGMEHVRVHAVRRDHDAIRSDAVHLGDLTLR